jgi:hypothetical protein
MLMPIAMTMATIVPLLSSGDPPFAAWRPALNENQIAPARATAFKKTSIQMVLLSRDFITASQTLSCHPQIPGPG